MDSDLYKAAESGNWGVIQQYPLDNQLNPNKDNVLHVLSRFCDSSSAVQQILGRNPKLLLKRNVYRDTPLHIAARKGHSDIVKAILDCMKRHESYRSVLRSENRDGNMPLHEAIKNNSREIIQMLVKEDQTLVNVRNGSLRSSLHLAAEKGDDNLVKLILSLKEAADHPAGTISKVEWKVNFLIGNGIIKFITESTKNWNVIWDKKNELHAAAIGNFPECIKLILRALPDLAQQTDKHGWKALDYAARLNHHEVVRELLQSHTVTGEDNALRIAVKWGHIQVIEEILTHRPGCWGTVSITRKNVIHVAVENEQEEVLDFILNKSWASELVNGKDKSGNTPLHFYVATKRLSGGKLVNHPTVERNALNQDGFTPLDSLRCAADQDIKRKESLRSELQEFGAIESRLIVSRGVKSETLNEEKLNKLTETYQVVATLIVGISFAAGFTIPGGYESNEGASKGTPIFLNKGGFIAFMIFDFAALSLSLWALTGLFLQLHIRDRTFQLINLAQCGCAIILSLGALFVTFALGLYMTLPNSGLRISLIMVSLVFVLSYVLSVISWGLGKRKVYTWELQIMRVMKVIRSS